MVLLPNLRMYNGKDISTSANHLRYVYSENLRSRVRAAPSRRSGVHLHSGFCSETLWFDLQIIALWERSFSLPDPGSAEKLSTVQQSFVSTARQQIKFGPSSVSDFTRWRVSSGRNALLSSFPLRCCSH